MCDSVSDIVNTSHRYILHGKDSNCDWNNVISAVSLLHWKSSYHLMQFRIQTQFIRSQATSKFIRWEDGKEREPTKGCHPWSSGWNRQRKTGPTRETCGFPGQAWGFKSRWPPTTVFKLKRQQNQSDCLGFSCHWGNLLTSHLHYEWGGTQIVWGMYMYLPSC